MARVGGGGKGVIKISVFLKKKVSLRKASLDPPPKVERFLRKPSFYKQMLIGMFGIIGVIGILPITPNIPIYGARGGVGGVIAYNTMRSLIKAFPSLKWSVY